MENLDSAMRDISKILMNIYKQLTELSRTGGEIRLSVHKRGTRRRRDPELDITPIAIRTKEELTDLDKQILAAFQKDPKPLMLRELAKLMGIPWQTVVRPLNRLVREGYVRKVRMEYGIPDFTKLPMRVRTRKPGRPRKQRTEGARRSAARASARKKSILRALQKSRSGLSMPELGKMMKTKWQGLRKPITSLVNEGIIDKVDENGRYKIIVTEQELAKRSRGQGRRGRPRKNLG